MYLSKETLFFLGKWDFFFWLFFHRFVPVPISKKETLMTTQSESFTLESPVRGLQFHLPLKGVMGSDKATHGFVLSGFENQDGDWTTSLGNMLNCLVVLAGKNLLLKASLKTSSFTLHLLLFSCQAPLDTSRYWVLFRFPQCCFFSRLNRHSFLSLFSQDKCFIAPSGFCWACFKLSVSFLQSGWSGGKIGYSTPGVILQAWSRWR